MLTKEKKATRQRRKMRVRRKIHGTAERPRLSVYKSLRHLYAQLVDDTTGSTVAFVTTNTKANKDGGVKTFANVANAAAVGRQLAEKAKSAGVQNVVFDRGGNRYHGVVKAVADAAREAGLKF